MKRGLLLLVILVVVLACGAALAALILHDGVSASATPTKLEEFLARHARRLATPANARAMVNPLPASEENLHDARMHFADHCAVCHGNDGSGQTMYGRGMYPKSPDMRMAATQSLSDGELYWIIENGVRFTGMPAFASHSSSQDSWKLVLFIRHLPNLSAEERGQMERANPKSPEERSEEQQEDDFLNGAAAPTPNASRASNKERARTEHAAPQ